MGGGPVFSCEAKSGSDQNMVEGSSGSAAVCNLLKVLAGGERNVSKVCCLERLVLAHHTALPGKASVVREDKIKDGQRQVSLSLDCSLLNMRQNQMTAAASTVS